MGTSSSTGKGNAAERKAVEVLEREGYVVHRAIRTQYRHGKGGWGNHGNDVFGCIDLIAKRHGERTRWIQVTAAKNNNRAKKARELEEIVPWDNDYDSVEIWRWIGGRGNQYFQLYHRDDEYNLKMVRTIQYRVE